MTTVTIFLVSAAALLQTSSPSATASGRVLDITGAALPAALVTAACGDTRVEAVADHNGEFRLSGVAAERCQVTASMDGFVTSRRVVNFGALAADIEFRLVVRPFNTHVTVTATRGREEDTSQVPQFATVTEQFQFDARPAALLTQALKEETGVLAQQTTSSQGSPILRGFTGQRNLYLIDGIRYNTAAWRDGPSQYMAWLPQANVEGIEIVRGPASSQYGSDAMGGTIAAIAPAFHVARQGTSGTASALFGTASSLRASDAAVGLERAPVSLRGGFAFSTVADLRAGRSGDSHAAVTRFLGIPSSVIGPRLENTSYTQTSVFGSARWSIANARGLTLSLQQARQDDAHRYDQEMGGNGRYLSTFAPQLLNFGYVRYEDANLAWFDGLTATVSVNRQADGRSEQARPSARIDEQSNTTTAFGYQVQATRNILVIGNAAFGADVYDEYIDGVRTLIEPNGDMSPSRPDIPDGTTYRSLGMYWQQTAELIPGRLTARGGLRYGHFGFKMREDVALGVPAEESRTSDVTYNAGAVLALTSELDATVSVGRGFRAANAFDLGAIGLSGGAGFEISPTRAIGLGGVRGSTDGATAVTTGRPIGLLEPEQLFSYEGGLRWHGRRASATATVFDLEFRDAIERRTIIFLDSVVGQDISGYNVVRQDAAGRAYVAADARPLVTRVNVSRARIRGFESDVQLRLFRDWTARAWASSARGTELETNTPRRRMPPTLGGATVTWRPAQRCWWVEGVVLAAAAQDRLSDGDLGDARIGAARTPASIAAFFNGTAADRGLVRNGVLVPTGETLAQVQDRMMGGAALLAMFTETPGFVTVGLRGGTTLGRHLDLSVIGENLTDRNSRLHGSGVDEPGAGLQIRLRARF